MLTEIETIRAKRRQQAKRRVNVETARVMRDVALRDGHDSGAADIARRMRGSFGLDAADVVRALRDGLGLGEAEIDAALAAAKEKED